MANCSSGDRASIVTFAMPDSCVALMGIMVPIVTVSLLSPPAVVIAGSCATLSNLIASSVVVFTGAAAAPTLALEMVDAKTHVVVATRVATVPVVVVASRFVTVPVVVVRTIVATVTVVVVASRVVTVPVVVVTRIAATVPVDFTMYAVVVVTKVPAVSVVVPDIIDAETSATLLIAVVAVEVESASVSVRPAMLVALNLAPLV